MARRGAAESPRDHLLSVQNSYGLQQLWPIAGTTLTSAATLAGCKSCAKRQVTSPLLSPADLAHHPQRAQICLPGAELACAGAREVADGCRVARRRALAGYFPDRSPIQTSLSVPERGCSCLISQFARVPGAMPGADL
eukprot:246033-Rhodomonas_salina.2